MTNAKDAPADAGVEHAQGMDMLTRLFAEAYRIDKSEWGGETEYVSALIDICRQRDSDFDMTMVNICKAAGSVRSDYER